MTECEWLTCDEPEEMLRVLRFRYSERKLRLFCCACCRLLPETIATGEPDVAVRVGEELAEGTANQAEAERTEAELRVAYLNYGDSFASWAYASELAYATVRSGGPLGYLLGLSARKAIDESFRENNAEEAHAIALLAKSQPALLRDIFGNPFRPVTVEPAWLTETVVRIAGQMYASRDFSAMPILADALQDAGCDNDDILTHCREVTEHMRGCWVVDLLLGKI